MTHLEIIEIKRAVRRLVKAELAMCREGFKTHMIPEATEKELSSARAAFNFLVSTKTIKLKPPEGA